MPKVEEPEPGVVLISCNLCGKPISKTTSYFGMDCEDDCARRKFHEERDGQRRKVYDRWLVILARSEYEGSDLYLLTLKQWTQYQEHRNGEDVCMAVSHTVQGDEFGIKAVDPHPPFFSTMAKLLEHVREHRLVLQDGEVGIGY